MTDTKWISDLKVGDKVIVDSSRSGVWCKSIKTVEKINKCYVKVNGHNYKMTSGNCKIDRWFPLYIEEATDENINKVRKMNHNLFVRNWFKKTDFNSDVFSIEQLDKAMEILKGGDYDKKDNKLIRFDTDVRKLRLAVDRHTRQSKKGWD